MPALVLVSDCSSSLIRKRMKQFVATLLIAIGSMAVANAQSFLDRLQRQGRNQGKVTVTQDAAIDELVNGSAVATTSTSKTSTAPSSKANVNFRTEQPTTNKGAETSETEPPIVDTRKKVMGKSYKVNGYRVQVFAGGNTRFDRQKAEKIGNDMKFKFPDVPIYVHFYSPRWICRMGNYRTYEEAHSMLLEVRKLGYKQASVVKGKISVQY